MRGWYALRVRAVQGKLRDRAEWPGEEIGAGRAARIGRPEKGEKDRTERKGRRMDEWIESKNEQMDE